MRTHATRLVLALSLLALIATATPAQRLSVMSAEIHPSVRADDGSLLVPAGSQVMLNVFVGVPAEITVYGAPYTDDGYPAEDGLQTLAAGRPDGEGWWSVFGNIPADAAGHHLALVIVARDRRTGAVYTQVERVTFVKGGGHEDARAARPALEKKDGLAKEELKDRRNPGGASDLREGREVAESEEKDSTSPEPKLSKEETKDRQGENRDNQRAALPLDLGPTKTELKDGILGVPTSKDGRSPGK